MGSPNDDLRSGRRDERARRHRDDDDDDEDEDEDDESSDGTTPRRGHRRFSDVARSPRDLTAARLEVIGQHRGCRRGNELKGGERTVCTAPTPLADFQTEVRSVQTFFTHPSVSTFDRAPFQLTRELFFAWLGTTIEFYRC
jgi:hypothetical protein